MSLWSSIFKGTHKISKANGEASPRWAARVESAPRDPHVRQRAAEELVQLSDPAGAVAHWIAAADIYLDADLPLKALAMLGCALRLDPMNVAARERIAGVARASPHGTNGSGESVCSSDGGDANGSGSGNGASHAPFFSDLAEADLAGIASQLRILTFVAGEILVREGESLPGLSILLEGAVAVLDKSGGGETAELGQLGPGDFVGGAWVLRGERSAATLSAETPGEILVWPREDVEASCRERPRLRVALESYLVAADDPGARAAFSRLTETD